MLQTIILGRTVLRIICVVLISAFLIACSSVPLATMFKLSDFENSDIANIRADELLVRLTLDDPIKLAKQKVRLQLKFKYSNKIEESYEFQLESNRVAKEFSSSGWFNIIKKRRSYEFKLTRLAQLEFSNFQRKLLEEKKIEKYFWTVFYYLAPHKESNAKIDVELKLSKSDDYFYLLKGATLEVGKKSK